MPNSIPVEEFLRDPDALVARVRNGEAELLTFDGEPGLVIQNAHSYETMQDELERLRLAQSLWDAERRMDAGQGIAWKDAKLELRARSAV